MSHLLFLDESGFDQRHSPYQVLAGVAIQMDLLWPLICEVYDAEEKIFGRRVSQGDLELKGKKILKAKTFRLAHQMPPLDPATRTVLARSCIDKGSASRGVGLASVTREELTALGQAKIAFAESILDLLQRHKAFTFASIVPAGAPIPPGGDQLRKDYSYLFERFFYFLERRPERDRGIIVFDELERSQCHMLVEQMHLYFRDTAKGRLRANRVIPEPFFVHSDLTTAIQLADLVAYVIAWGLELPGMNSPARPEMAALANRVKDLHFVTRRKRPNGDPLTVYSLVVIDDLRTRQQKGTRAK